MLNFNCFSTYPWVIHIFDHKRIVFCHGIYPIYNYDWQVSYWTSNLDPPIFNQTKVSWRKQIRYSIFLSSWIFGRIKNRHFKSTCRSWWQYMHRFQSRQWIIQRFVIIFSLLCHRKIMSSFVIKKSRVLKATFF